MSSRESSASISAGFPVVWNTVVEAVVHEITHGVLLSVGLVLGVEQTEAAPTATVYGEEGLATVSEVRAEENESLLFEARLHVSPSVQASVSNWIFLQEFLPSTKVKK